jgi:CRISPR/Cas system-associated protein Cas10 (large subunit of type III CRISPR-Cas system)
MEEIYTKELVSISVTTHREHIDGDFSAALANGEKAIRRKKESKQYSYQLNSSPYYKRCALCGIYPAESKSYDKNKKKYDLLCASCSVKRYKSKKWLDIHTDIKQKFKANGKVIKDFPIQFNQIGDASRKEGYMGFIMADANRMGEKIRNIHDPNELEQFSKKIEEINKSCLVDAIWQAFENTPLKDNLLPVNILILGGDDMVMVTTAETAIKIALEYCDKFQKATKPEISISAAVVIAKDTYPINSYVALGEELLKMAKKKSREYLDFEEDKEVGTIDYKVVTGAFSESINITRYKKDRYYKKDNNEFLLTFKPYSLEDMGKLTYLGAEFKEKNFPRNKIKSFENMLRLGKGASILEFLTMKSRLSKEQKGIMDKFLGEFDMVNLMPWRKKGDKYESNLLDLVEIYEILGDVK